MFSAHFSSAWGHIQALSRVDTTIQAGKMEIAQVRVRDESLPSRPQQWRTERWTKMRSEAAPCTIYRTIDAERLCVENTPRI